MYRISGGEVNRIRNATFGALSGCWACTLGETIARQPQSSIGLIRQSYDCIGKAGYVIDLSDDPERGMKVIPHV